MELKKIFSKILIVAIFIITLLGLTAKSDAAETTLYLGLEEFRESGFGYKVDERIVWKMV